MAGVDGTNKISCGGRYISMTFNTIQKVAISVLLKILLYNRVSTKIINYFNLHDTQLHCTAFISVCFLDVYRLE